MNSASVVYLYMVQLRCAFRPMDRRRRAAETLQGADDNMDLMWGQHVAAHEVWLGRLYGAMLVKESGAVTHLVVKRGFGRGRLCVIPLASVNRRVSEAVYTEMPLDEALQQPILKRLDGEQFIVALTPKTRVLAADGKRLKLRGVRISTEGHGLEWLVLSPRMRGRRLLVPSDKVTEFATGKVTLAIESSGLKAMPVYRQDAHVEADLRERLSKASTVPQGELRGVALTVEDGTVAFHGNVKSRHTVDALRNVTRQIKGASSLLMDLKCDSDMELEIAASLADHTRGNGGPLQVSSLLGQVKLSGHLPDDGRCRELVKAVEVVPGVRGVELSGS